MLTRTVVISTANAGRGVTWEKFKQNIDKIIAETPGTHRFFNWQEIGEADFDGKRELEYIQDKLTKTHRFAGLQTHVPIAIPRTFRVKNRSVVVASEGVDHLSPRRHVVRAVVSPVDHPQALVHSTNTHFARDAPPLALARAQADEVLRERLTIDVAGWLTADLNSSLYSKLGKNEMRLVNARLDVIRAYERDGVTFELLKTGSINMSIDGHNAHWARVKITWP